MNKIAKVVHVLAFSLLLSHSIILSSDNISIDKNKTLQIIGLATAIGGIVILSRENGSTFLGLVLLIAGTATVIYPEKIIKKSPTFCNKIGKAANTIYNKLQQYLYEEPKPEQQPST